MTTLSTESAAIVKVVASDRSWIEGEALRQLEQTVRLEGMVAAVGLPDLHPGRGTPIGAAFLCRGFIYPYLIGSDAGCGIALFKTDLQTRKVKRDKWARKLIGLEAPWDGDVEKLLQANDLDASLFPEAMGTIGGGNHFAELQLIEKIYCEASAASIGLDKKHLVLLIHSGSRGLGDLLLRSHTERFGSGGLGASSKEAVRYLKSHGDALVWARLNRGMISRRFAGLLNAECVPVLDTCHNRVNKVEVNGHPHWLHRKGAAQSDSGMLVVPGSRGALSYLVKPVGDQSANLWSVAHGAGRKWNRIGARVRVKAKTTAKALLQTDLGSVVICDDKNLLYEEAPDAYKRIESVISDMVDARLVQVVATMRPLITYKVRRET